jgi:hypothetical protein
MNTDAVNFWCRYIVQNRFAARMIRTAALALIAWCVGYFLTLPLNEPIVTPHRGDFSLRVHQWLSVPAHVTMYLLIFFVVDATVFCVCLCAACVVARPTGRRAR